MPACSSWRRILPGLEQAQCHHLLAIQPPGQHFRWTGVACQQCWQPRASNKSIGGPVRARPGLLLACEPPQCARGLAGRGPARADSRQAARQLDSQTAGQPVGRVGGSQLAAAKPKTYLLLVAHECQLIQKATPGAAARSVK